MGHRVTTLNVNTIEPAGATLTIGADGDSVVVGGNDIRANTYKDAGGNTLFVSNGSGVLSSVNSGFGDSLKLLSTQTASNSASISFTSGITSTYKEYIFKFINIDPVTDGGGGFAFQVSTNGGSDYNITATSTFFRAYHAENNSEAILEYDSSYDLAQATGYQNLMTNIGNASDENGCGELHLFNPANTTYIKNFYSTCSTIQSNEYQSNGYAAGYFNTTSAINAISFKMVSGNISSGKIKMYGVA